MIPTTDITSFSEVRKHLREHLNRLRVTGRPLYVTTNGETEAVLLSPAVFDALRDKAELADSLIAIDRSAEDIKAGRVHPFRESIQGIARELGVRLDP